VRPVQSRICAKSFIRHDFIATKFPEEHKAAKSCTEKDDFFQRRLSWHVFYPCLCARLRRLGFLCNLYASRGVSSQEMRQMSYKTGAEDEKRSQTHLRGRAKVE
jgi:hypothetical protein